MVEALRAILEAHPAVAYALLFGSAAKGTMHARSDVDVAIGTAGARTSALEFGLRTSELEQAARRPVHLVLLDEAPPALAHRIFRGGSSFSSAIGPRSSRAARARSWNTATSVRSRNSWSLACCAPRAGACLSLEP